MKAPRSLHPSVFDYLSPDSTDRTDRLAAAIAFCVAVAREVGAPKQTLIEAIEHIWPATDRH